MFKYEHLQMISSRFTSLRNSPPAPVPAEPFFRLLDIRVLQKDSA